MNDYQMYRKKSTNLRLYKNDSMNFKNKNHIQTLSNIFTNNVSNLEISSQFLNKKNPQKLIEENISNMKHSHYNSNIKNSSFPINTTNSSSNKNISCNIVYNSNKNHREGSIRKQKNINLFKKNCEIFINFKFIIHYRRSL